MPAETRGTPRPCKSQAAGLPPPVSWRWLYLNKDCRTQLEPAHKPWGAFHSCREMWVHHPPRLLITLSQLNLGQGLKPALGVAAEAGGGMSPLHQACGDALLARSVCAHTTAHAGSLWAAPGVSGDGTSHEQKISYPAQKGWPAPRGVWHSPAGAGEGPCKLKAWSFISCCFPSCSHSILKGLQ